MKLLNNLDLNKNQTLNRVMQNLGTDPGSPVAGQEFYDTSANVFKFYNGSAWKNPLARADHTGQQTASTISDLATVVKAYRLDEFAAPTSAIPMNGQKITGLADPTSAQDAATMGWVQLQMQGFTPKGSADAATTAALPACTYANGTAGSGATLTGTAVGVLTVDSFAVTLDSLILVKDQASAFQNGLYECTRAGTAGISFILTRAANMDVSTEYGGAYIVVEATSTANSGAIFVCNTNAPTVGTTAITFTNINTTNTYTADGTTLQVSGNTFSIKSSYVGQTSITTLGTIGTGVWNATAISIAKGGTGQATAAAGFNALSPLTTLGDIIFASAANTASRLAGNVTTTKMMLSQTGNGSVSAAPVWAALVAADIPALDTGKMTTGTLPVARGGTGGATAAAARSSLGATTKYSALIGDNAALSYTITHNMGSVDLVASVVEVSTGAVVYPDVTMTNINTTTVSFSVAPAAGQYRITIVG